jgi:hypothetical protein
MVARCGCLLDARQRRDLMCDNEGLLHYVRSAKERLLKLNDRHITEGSVKIVKAQAHPLMQEKIGFEAVMPI